MVMVLIGRYDGGVGDLETKKEFVLDPIDFVDFGHLYDEVFQK